MKTQPKTSSLNQEVNLTSGGTGWAGFNPSIISHYPFLPIPTPLPTNLPNLTFINVGDTQHINFSEKIRVTDALLEQILANFPTWFSNRTTILIPRKVKSAVARIRNEFLDKIHEDRLVATELCLLFLSKFSDSYYRLQRYDGNCHSGYRALHSSILRVEFPYDSNTYLNIINALRSGTVKGEILNRDSKYIPNKKCYNYRLGTAYQCKGTETYEIKSSYVRDLHIRNLAKAWLRSCENPIAKNLAVIQTRVQLPTLYEIQAAGARLTADKEYRTKKGNRLVSLDKSKKSRNFFGENVSFLEDHIERFESLTSLRLKVPVPGDERSGGRIVDSFTLMPSWIRKLCKIDGEYIVEVDYSALHPNIAVSLYGGHSRFITHHQVSQEAEIKLADVKKEHLSFFNKPWNQMQLSPLFGYYMKKEPEMMINMSYDKCRNDLPEGERHKITSRRMFAKEVEIMTDVIRKLNQEGVYVGYVYDALFCHPKQRDRVLHVMNEVVLEHQVYTTAK